MAGLLLLLLVKNKDVALCLTLFALSAGFAMNISKAYRLPKEESATAFSLNTLKFVPAIFALSSFTFLAVAYPLVAATGNATVAIVVYSRGKRVAIADSMAD